MTDYKSLLNTALTKRVVYLDQLEEFQGKLKEVNRDIKDHEQARAVFQKAAKLTQKHLANHLSGIVSKALKSIFKNPYKFVVKFEERRGTTECDLLLERDGKQFKPLKSCGFGVADVVSITLRVAFLLMSGRSKVLILDEPGRHVSVDRMPYLSNVLRQLSIDLGIQFIIVTHSKELSEYADNIFRVRNDNERCIIENKP